MPKIRQFKRRAYRYKVATAAARTGRKLLRYGAAMAVHDRKRVGHQDAAWYNWASQFHRRMADFTAAISAPEHIPADELHPVWGPLPYKYRAALWWGYRRSHETGYSTLLNICKALDGAADPLRVTRAIVGGLISHRKCTLSTQGELTRWLLDPHLTLDDLCQRVGWVWLAGELE
jgi:hypothetical protein